MPPEGPKKSATSKATPEPSISPEAYNSVIEALTPMEIRLKDLTFGLKSPVHSGPLLATVQMYEPEKVSEVQSPTDGGVHVDIEQTAILKIISLDESLAAEGRVIFAIRVRVDFAPPAEFWPIFLKRNVKLYTHPALRDLISSLTTRAGLLVQPLNSISVTQLLAKAPEP